MEGRREGRDGGTKGGTENKIHSGVVELGIKERD